MRQVSKHSFALYHVPEAVFAFGTHMLLVITHCGEGFHHHSLHLRKKNTLHLILITLPKVTELIVKLSHKTVLFGSLSRRSKDLFLNMCMGVGWVCTREDSA